VLPHFVKTVAELQVLDSVLLLLFPAVCFDLYAVNHSLPAMNDSLPPVCYVLYGTKNNKGWNILSAGTNTSDNCKLIFVP